ncbi:MAG TPA: GNAT family N-acetyltransferase [Pirellulales bacterium]|nr:GNAT family N-acetyltransferase [Pirellulales bacterium]
MPNYRIEILRSIADLRQAAGAWDDLWQRSSCANPSARAEPLAAYLEHFAPRARLGTVVVHGGGQAVAALPLLAERSWTCEVGQMPGNCWSSGGALLLDFSADPRPALDALVDGLRRLGWPLLRLDAVMPTTLAWQGFGAALSRAGIRPITRPRCRVDQIEVSGDWPSYLAGRGYNLRRQIRRLISRTNGEATLRIFDRLSPDELATWLRRGFAVEDQGWKGRAGSSVLRNPAIFEFYLRQAEHFGAANEMRLVFLEYHGRPIAFEYGWQGKGTYFPLKVGYDEAVRQFSPGQLLRAMLVEQCFTELLRLAPPSSGLAPLASPCGQRSLDRGLTRHIDFLGPSSRATHEFATSDYPVARWYVPLRRSAALALRAYETLSPLASRLRRASPVGEIPAPAGQTDAEAPARAPDAEPVAL